jgi:dienelactone hydrolase
MPDELSRATATTVVDDGLKDAWGKQTAANTLSPLTFETCELFFARLGQAGMDWGDITNALKGLRKESTHDDWAHWHQRWSGLADDYERRFDAAIRAGRKETARISGIKAAACHHFAEFFFFADTALKFESRRKVTELFDRNVPYLRETVAPLTVPIVGYPAAPGYLIAPQGSGPFPTVILINGLDSAKEVELYAFAREFAARGLAAVVFDGPGQGVFAGKVPMPVDFENVVRAVVDAVSDLPAVDAARLGIFGVSFGGYLAVRAAAHIPDLRACVNLSGGFDHDHYRQINPLVRTDFRFVFGVGDDEAMERICRTSLNLKQAQPLRIPLLSIHGQLDSIIPIESARRVVDWAQGGAELIQYPGERHVATNYFGDFIPRLADWLAEHLGAVNA